MKQLIFKHRSHSSEKVILFVQFRAVLGLRCGAGFSLAAASRLFPSCSAQSNPVASHCRARGAGASEGAALGLRLQFPGSLLRCTDSVAPRPLGSFLIRDRTCVSCTVREILTTEPSGKPQKTLF